MPGPFSLTSWNSRVLTRAKTSVNIMYLFTNWEGRMGKYLARSHGVMQRDPNAMTEGQIFYDPARPNLVVNTYFFV